MTEIEKFYAKEAICGLELEKRFIQKRQLILAAKPYMDIMNDLSCILVLTDTDGCILYISGNEAIKLKASQSGLKKGAFAYINTQGNKNVFIGNNDIQFEVFGTSVFVNEKISGIIGVFWLQNNVAEITYSFKETIKLLSYSIGKAASMNMELEYLSSKVNSLQNIFDSLTCAAVVFDMKGNFRIINKKALNIIGMPYDKEIGMKAYEIIEQFDDIKRLLLTNGTFKGKVKLNTLKGCISADIDAVMEYDYSCNMPVAVCAVKEMPRIGKGFYYDEYIRRANYTFNNIIGQDPYFIKIIDYAKKISDLKSPLLITGETGSGKSMLAMAVHNWSSRMDENFVEVNCACLPEELIDSEIFGSELKSGKLEMADKGTLVLDNVENIPQNVQMKLVEFIENGSTRKADGDRNITPDVRIIALTSQDLKKNMEKGKFMKELYYRLNILSIYLPPLRNRKNDIILLVNNFTGQICKRLNRKMYQYSPYMLKKIEKYDWHGNVRELKNVIEKIVICGGISEDYFDEGLQFDDMSDESMKLDYIEKQHIIRVIKMCSGNMTHAADILGIRRSTLYSKIKKIKIT